MVAHHQKNQRHQDIQYSLYAQSLSLNLNSTDRWIVMAAITLLSAADSTGAGDIKQLPHLVGNHVVQVTSTGSPTTVTLALEGSIDGSTWFVLDSSTYTASNNMNFAIDMPVTYVRLNLTNLSGGSSPTVTGIYEGDNQGASKTGRRGQF